MPIIYYAAMAVAALVLLVLFIRSELKLNMCYVLVYATVVIANWGYLALASSDVMEEALLANKIAYIGGCLLPFLMFLAVADLCNIRIPNLLTDALLFLDIVLLFCAFTAGHNELFYRSQTLGDFYGTSYLIKEYGPLHTLYILYWVGYMVAITALVVYSLFRKELVSYKTTFILGILLATNVLIYLVERLIKIPIELMPLAYCISTALLLMRLQKINLYDMSSNVLNVLRRRSEYGYITFTTDLRYVGHNEYAEKIYPEVRKLHIDCKVGEGETPFYREIMQWLSETAKRSDRSMEKKIVHDEQILKCDIKPILHGSRDKHVGYLVEFIDDTRQQNYINMIEKFNVTLKSEVDKKTERLQKMQEEIILGFANMVESRDHVTGGHIKRTSGYVRILAEKLRGSEMFPEFNDDAYVKHICMAAPLHDIGKISIPDSILNKPGKYEPEEYEIMKQHPVLGGNILNETLASLEDREYYEVAWQMAMFHHERWDGKGYPNGLSGEQIPLCARVMAVADVFDALTSKRPYKDEFSMDRAFAIIEEGKGTQFDPRLVDVCLACRPRFEAFWQEQKKSGNNLTKEDLENMMQTVLAVGAYTNAYQVSNAEWGKFVGYAKNLAVRNKQTMSLLLFTIRSRSGRELSEEQKKAAMSGLKAAAVSSLRTTDMTTQISDMQRVVMLVNLHAGGVQVVTQRIETAFYNHCSDPDIYIEYVESNP